MALLHSFQYFQKEKLCFFFVSAVLQTTPTRIFHLIFLKTRHKSDWKTFGQCSINKVNWGLMQKMRQFWAVKNGLKFDIKQLCSQLFNYGFFNNNILLFVKSSISIFTMQYFYNGIPITCILIVVLSSYVCRGASSRTQQTWAVAQFM